MSAMPRAFYSTSNASRHSKFQYCHVYAILRCPVSIILKQNVATGILSLKTVASWQTTDKQLIQTFIEHTQFSEKKHWWCSLMGRTSTGKLFQTLSDRIRHQPTWYFQYGYQQYIFCGSIAAERMTRKAALHFRGGPVRGKLSWHFTKYKTVSGLWLSLESAHHCCCLSVLTVQLVDPQNFRLSLRISLLS